MLDLYLWLKEKNQFINYYFILIFYVLMLFFTQFLSLKLSFLLIVNYRWLSLYTSTIYTYLRMFLCNDKDIANIWIQTADVSQFTVYIFCKIMSIKYTNSFYVKFCILLVVLFFLEFEDNIFFFFNCSCLNLIFYLFAVIRVFSLFFECLYLCKAV